MYSNMYIRWWVYFVTGLIYVLQLPTTTKLAKTKADIVNKNSYSYSSSCFQVSGNCQKALLWLSNDCLMTSPWLYFKFTPKYMDSFDMSTNSKSGLTITWIVLVQISRTFNLFWWSESHWSILQFFKDQARASDPVTSKLDFYAGNAF